MDKKLSLDGEERLSKDPEAKPKPPKAFNTNQKSRASWRPREASVPDAFGVPDKGGW